LSVWFRICQWRSLGYRETPVAVWVLGPNTAGPSRSLDPPRPETTTIAEGTVTLAEVSAHLFPERHGAALHYRELIDARHATVKLSSAEVRVKKTATDVVFQVHQLCYGVLTTELQKEADELQLTSRSENLNESTEQVKNGSLLEVARVESQANLLEAKQRLLINRRPAAFRT
jgi:outer membrane protein TolC